ncbi:Dynein_light domain-containing protein [Cephalotus follicularis]|uniref:Dynein light chain n=1 Tax=Cephalotus follicularis TaxID=3775 RepID=A0A1Q3BKD6_CEPFO|nr:Dynein_light domain-containing protein [Cephalotus follicularis]
MATTQEKQKKGFMSMSFYKSSTKKSKPKMEPLANTDKPNKPPIVLSTKMENFQAMEHGGRRKIEGRELFEARKSVSHIETNLASVAAFLQVKIMMSDMPGNMQVHAFRCARRAYDGLEKFSSKHMAYDIKKEFDKVYGPAWHCIVGSSFGSFVTHSTGCFLYFSMEKLRILIFKTKVLRA